MTSIADVVRRSRGQKKGKDRRGRRGHQADPPRRAVASATVSKGRAEVVRPSIADYGSPEHVHSVVQTAIARGGSFYDRQSLTLPAAGTGTITVNSGLAGVDYPVCGLKLTIAPPTSNTKGVVGINISIAGNWFDGDVAATAQSAYIKFLTLEPIEVIFIFGEINTNNSSRPNPRALRARDAAHASPDLVVTYTAPEGTTVLQETIDGEENLTRLLS